MKTLVFNVVGKVQGVFFRKSSQERAKEIGIHGWIKNEENGSVSGIAQGSDIQLAEWKEWLQSGPTKSRVDRIKYEETQGPVLDSFEIR